MLEIVLSIAGLLCLIVVLLGCLDCLYKKKRFQAFGIRDTTHAEHNAAFSVDIFDSDSISEPVIIEPLPDILSKVSAVPVLRPRITCTERGKQEAALSLLSVQRSFPRDHLTYLNEIGSGWFGKVIQSEAVKIVAGSYTSHVVVKVLKDDASKLEQKQFMEEVVVFRCLEHTNLVRFLGQCTEATPYLVILEFAAHGNLKSYLVRQRQEVDTLTSTNRLINFALDASAGLACLHRHDYIHCDLAARNCLVMSDFTLKIGDYGISDHLFKDEYFNTGTELLPVRWMAPESLSQVDGVWTSQRCNKTSDMWSFGILLWEICSLGRRPYDNLSNESVLQNVVLDRLVLPSEVNTKLPFKVKMWSIMIQCWEEPSQRLDIEQVHDILEQLKTKLDDMAAFSDFDQKWNHLEPNNGKRPSINLESQSPLVSNLITDSTSAQDKPSPLCNELEAPDMVTMANVVINVDGSVTNSSRGLDDLSVPAILIEPSVDHNFSKAEQNDSSYAQQCQVMLENELNKSSTPASQSIPAGSLDQPTVSTAGSVSQGSGSTSQFFSPHSSPSSEYMTMSDSFAACNQEETVKEMASIDKDYSIDSEGISCDFMEDTVMLVENNVGNNNNVLSKSFSPSHVEDEDFCDYVHMPPTRAEEVLELKSAATPGNDSLNKDQTIPEDDLCNKDASLLRTDIMSPSGLNGINSKSSEFVASADVESDKNLYASFSISASTDKQDFVNSASLMKSNTYVSSSIHDALTHYLVTADVHSEPESTFPTDLSELQFKSNTSSRNVFINLIDDNTDSPTLGSSINITEESKSGSRKNTESPTLGPTLDGEIINEYMEFTCESNSNICENPFSSLTGDNIESPTLGTTINMKIGDESNSNKENVSQQEIEEKMIEHDHIFPSEKVEPGFESSLPCLGLDFSAIMNSVDSGTGSEASVLQSQESSSVTSLQEHSKNVELELTHLYPIKDEIEENKTKLVIDNSGNAFNSIEIFNQNLSSDPYQLSDQTLSRVAGETDGSQDVLDTSNKNCSNSAESGMHSESMAEDPTNNASTYSVDSLVHSHNMPGGDSSDAVIQDSDYVEDSWPLNFKSSLYRCSSINLAEDVLNEAEAEENFKSNDDNEDLEDSQSPVDSDTESSTSNSGSGQEYFLSGHTKSEQPMTSSPDLANINPDLASRKDTESPTSGDFDDYALQIVSEIYLSRGVKSPRVFEIPPLETIPEHQPLPSIQEDSNYTPSDTSSVEVRYEDMFGSDSFEWDDFYGDPLIGKDMSLQTTPNTPSFRGHDVSDWSMDLDSESFVSNTSMTSMKSEELSLSTSAQSEKLFTVQTNISADSSKSIFSSSDSELFSSTHSKSTDSSKGTLVSSLLSHLQSPGISCVSNFGQNNFYSLMERYDIETDSSSDGLASPLGTITSPSKSFTSVAYPISYESPPTSQTESHSLLLSGSRILGNHTDLDPSITSSVSNANEETEILSEKSSFTINPLNSLLSSNTHLVTASHNGIAPSENVEDEEHVNSHDLKTIKFNFNQNVTSSSGSTDSDKEDVIMKSQDNDSLDVLSSQDADSSFIEF